MLARILGKEVTRWLLMMWLHGYYSCLQVVANVQDGCSGVINWLLGVFMVVTRDIGVVAIGI